MATRKTKRKTRAQAHRALLRAHVKFYDGLLAFQGGGCAICGRPPGKRRHAKDHDHRTMQLRGILCYRCNTALRTWVTPEWLRDAADYLEFTPWERYERTVLNPQPPREPTPMDRVLKGIYLPSVMQALNQEIIWLTPTQPPSAPSSSSGTRNP